VAVESAEQASSNGTGAIFAHPATTPTHTRRHSAPVRGVELVPTSSFPEGRFGRMFRHLPVFEQTEADLKRLARKMVQRAEDPKDEVPDGEFDEDENAKIPAGYTYLGQFVDHDLTFDPASSLQRQNDPDALHDFRTPRFDLDSLYGRGPADQPYLYVHDPSDPKPKGAPQGLDVTGLAFLTGERVSNDDADDGPDLPRNRPRETFANEPIFHSRALIGDPRNDENLIVSQLHSTFLDFHNQMVVKAHAETGMTGDDLFKEAQRLVRWHYQWAVLTDFLPRIVGQDTVNDVLREETYKTAPDGREVRVLRPRLLFYEPQDDPYIPVEFSVAAYRFGHSMIRPGYFINTFVKQARANHKPQRIPIFSAVRPEDDELQNLNGFRRLPGRWGIEWKFFFDMPGADREGQHSYKIDTELGHPLGHLPPDVAKDPSSLALRNLLRGMRLDLPSGQRVARAMGITPLTAQQLDLDGDLGRHTPLWYYVLKEAEVEADSESLGPVGGRIVAEVLVGLLAGDPLSFLGVEPTWRPTDLANGGGGFGMPELIRFAKRD
jgi:hypothetical protein